MPIIQVLENFERVRLSLPEDPIYINDLPNTTEDDRKVIRDLILTRYTSDMISMLPRCSCGNTKGQFLVGVTCVDCGTKVTPTITKDIQPSVWVRAPAGSKWLINPIILIMMKDIFTKSGFNVIHWLMDTSYKAPVKTPDVVRKIEASGIERGYNYFINNMGKILDYLFSLSDFKKSKKNLNAFRRLLLLYNDCIFSQYLPLPNKSLIVFEKTSLGEYTSFDNFKILDSVLHLASIDKDFYDQRSIVKENRTAKALFLLANFYETYFKQSLCGKPGQYRKHVFGTRTNFSFRAVISSNTDIHQYDEITVPWQVGLTCLRPMLINKLTKRGYDHLSALQLIMTNIEKYNPLLDELLTEILDESTCIDRDGVEKRGIITLLQRNPSLLQGSFVRVRITNFHKDPRNKTIWMSIFLCGSLNADFDGDAVNCSIILDRYMANLTYALDHRFNVYALDTPLKISGNTKLPKPAISTMSAAYVASMKKLAAYR